MMSAKVPLLAAVSVCLILTFVYSVRGTAPDGSAPADSPFRVTVEADVVADVIRADRPVDAGQRAEILPDKATPIEESLFQLAETMALASIIGTVRYEGDAAPGPFSIALFMDGSSRENRELDFSSSDFIPVPGGWILPWELEAVPVGVFRIRFADALLQEVTIVPGVNLVETELGITPDVQLLFVDSATGESISVHSVAWAAFQGTASTDFGFDEALHPRQRQYIGGDTFTISDSPANQIVMRIRGDTVRTKVQTLRLDDGPVQVVELESVLLVTLMVVDSDGGSAFTSNAAESASIVLVVDGVEHKSISYGSKRGRPFAKFAGLDALPGRWSLKLPSQYSVNEPCLESLSPGAAVAVQVQIE